MSIVNDVVECVPASPAESSIQVHGAFGKVKRLVEQLTLWVRHPRESFRAWSTTTTASTQTQEVIRTKEIATTEMETTCNKIQLVDLAPEIILCVVAQLEDFESHALLALTCKRFYQLLTSQQRVSFPNRATRIRFLQVYEREFPDYITCRNCGRLFRWRRYYLSYSYLRRHGVPFCCYSTDVVPHSFGAGDDYISFQRERIDVILKGEELGERYGLLLSKLDAHSTGGVDFDGSFKTWECRLVRGELLIFATLTQEAASWSKAKWIAGLNCFSACQHKLRSPETNGIVNTLWPIVHQLHRAGEGNDVLQESDLLKCMFCQTQFRLSMQGQSTKSSVLIKFSIWKSFGTRYDNSVCNEQMFSRDTKSHVVVESLSQRNLQEAFESSRPSPRVFPGHDYPVCSVR